MPVKVVIFGVAAAAAVGAVVWHNREHIREMAEQTRDDVREFAGERIAELAELLRRVADKISPDRQEEIPMRGRALGFSPSPSSDSDRRSGRSGSLPRSPADPFANPPGNRITYQQPLMVTGREAEYADGLRLRGAAGGVPVPFAVPSYNDHHQQEMLLAPSVASSSTASSQPAIAPVLAAFPPSPSASTLIAVSAVSQQQQGEEEEEAHSSTLSMRSASDSRTLSSASEAVAVTPPANPFENPQPFWNIPEWQENTTADALDTPSSPSLAGSAADELDGISDIASESGSEGSWMEVASVTSDDDMINH